MSVSEVPSRQHLRSTRHHQLSVPRVRRPARFAFSVAGPTVWNSLPDYLTDSAVDCEHENTSIHRTFLPRDAL